MPFLAAVLLLYCRQGKNNSMIKKIVGVAFGAFFLSGCVFSAPVPVAVTPPQDAFTQKVKAGSLWKSTDGGQAFVVQSRVDDKTSITKADVLALAFHPQDSRTIYAGTVDNGIFKTTNGGDSWVALPFPPKKIYSFILDKKQPDQRMFASGMLNNIGKIFRTDNSGTTWNEVYSEPGNQVVITALAQHESDTNVLFAGTSTGTVIKSTDGGDTWKNIGSVVDGPVTDIVFDAVKPFSLYALSFNKTLTYSPDGGKTWVDWEKVKQEEIQKRNASSKNGKAPAVPTPEEQAAELAKQMPSALLAAVSDRKVSGRVYVSKLGGLYRSNDFGKHWEKLNIIESAEKFPIRSLAINPSDSNELVFAAGSAFYKTKNGGSTWAVVDLFVDRGVSVLAYDPSNPLLIYMGLRKL